MNASQRNLLGKRERKKIHFCHDSNSTLLPSLSAACQCCCSRWAPSAASLPSDLSSLYTCSSWGSDPFNPAQHFNRTHQRRSRVQVVFAPNCSSACLPSSTKKNLPIVLFRPGIMTWTWTMDSAVFKTVLTWLTIWCRYSALHCCARRSRKL